MQKLLIIYTGGTIGMIKDEKGVLNPFNFDNLTNYIPSLNSFAADIHTHSFECPIDSSDVDIDFWHHLVEVIECNYNYFDGFIILHGTDTMSYTASALSFMLENLAKPIILTGSQLPLGLIRTDGRENIVAAIELACMKKNEAPLIQEVCVYFENSLYRGNRTKKNSSQNFDAFISPNYPPLADVGIDIVIHENNLWKNENKELIVHKSLSNDIAILKFFPGISLTAIDATLNISNLKALIIETYGSGNLPTNPILISRLEKAINKGLIVLNISQCPSGKVQQGKYATSLSLENIGVISGKDMTIEAAVTKLMFVLGNNYNLKKAKDILLNSLCGEIS